MTDHNRGHVCIFTTAHPTDDVRVNTRMAGSLLEAGYSVSWVGPAVSYFADSTHPDDRITYHLFRKNDSKMKRLRADRCARLAAANVEGVDWWYCPDPDAAAAAVKIARARGGRVLFDVHEVFHGALLDRWFPARPPVQVREVVRRRIARTCRRVALVTGVSQSVIDSYVTDDSPQVLTRNCAPRFFAQLESSAPDTSVRTNDGQTRIMHGKLSVSNGTMTVVDALAYLEPDVAAVLSVLFTRGPGAADNQLAQHVVAKVADTLASDAVDIRPGVPHEQMPGLLRHCQVGMIAYGRALGVDSLPNRLFEYMACGLAILAPSYSSEIAKIVDQEQIGLVADFEDPMDVARALRWISEHPTEIASMGARAQRAFMEKYNWDAEAARLLEAMANLEEGDAER